MDIFKKLKEIDFPIGEYVVVGGAMAAHGIREAHDLDILVTPNLYQKLLEQGYNKCLCENCLRTNRILLKKDNVDILPNYILGRYVGDTTTLINTADIINGYPFIKLSELIKFKKALARKKDFDDIKLIETYLEKVV